jgi:hypothetical protein
MRETAIVEVRKLTTELLTILIRTLELLLTKALRLAAELLMVKVLWSGAGIGIEARPIVALWIRYLHKTMQKLLHLSNTLPFSRCKVTHGRSLPLPMMCSPKVGTQTLC